MFIGDVIRESGTFIKKSYDPEMSSRRRRMFRDSNGSLVGTFEFAEILVEEGHFGEGSEVPNIESIASEINKFLRAEGMRLRNYKNGDEPEKEKEKYNFVDPYASVVIPIPKDAEEVEITYENSDVEPEIRFFRKVREEVV